MKLTQNRFTIAVGFWLAVLILAAAGLWTHQSTLALLNSFTETRHTYALIESLTDVLAGVKDAESRQQSYGLTGDERLLVLYRAALEHVRNAVLRLEELTAGSVRQQRRLAALQPLIVRRLAGLQARIELRQTRGIAAAPERAGDAGPTLLAQISTLLREMRAEEDAVLKERETRLRWRSQTAVGIFVVGTFVSFGMLFVVFYFLNQQIAAREVADRGLQRAHDELELRVQARTAELANTNQALQLEINERRRAETAQIRAELQFRELVESVQAIVWRADAQTFQFNFVSKSAELILGYPVDRWLTEPKFWENHIAPDDRGWAVLYSTEATRQKEAHDFEYRMIAADGRVVWLHNVVRVIVDNDQPKEIVSVMMDISEHRRADEALQASEERFRRLAEESTQVLWFADLNPERVTYVSPAFETIWGWPAEELYANPRLWMDAVHPEDRARVEELFGTFIKGQTAHFDVEYRVINRQGATRWIHDRGTAIRDVAGEIHRVSGIAGDITERKLAEHALRQSQQLLQSTIDVLSAHIAILDERGTILAVNRPWRRFADQNSLLTADYGVGTNYLYVCDAISGDTGEFAAQVAQGIREIIKGLRAEFWMEYPCHSPGEQRWFQLRVTSFKWGAEVRLVVVHENVTEIKKVQEGLRTLSGRLLELQDRERRHIARELHDTTAQNLSAVTLNLARLHELTAVEEKPRRLLAESLQLAEQSLREIRTLSYLLHPPLLDEAGLVSALRWYVDGFTQRSGIPVDLVALPDMERLPADIEHTLFRVAQEALTNIHRHSGAKRASIQVARSAADVVMEIRDDGRGLTAAGGAGNEFVTLGVGIMGMRERLRQLGGALIFQPSQHGTTLRATVPLGRTTV